MLMKILPPYEKRDNQRKSQKDDVIKLREKIYPEISMCEYKNWSNIAITAKI